MKFVPKAERGSWHDRAMLAAQVAELHAPIELLVETRELERPSAPQYRGHLLGVGRAARYTGGSFKYS